MYTYKFAADGAESFVKLAINSTAPIEIRVSKRHSFRAQKGCFGYPKHSAGLHPQVG